MKTASVIFWNKGCRAMDENWRILDIGRWMRATEGL
jgi:hypothetical protein